MQQGRRQRCVLGWAGHTRRIFNISGKANTNEEMKKMLQEGCIPGVLKCTDMGKKQPNEGLSRTVNGEQVEEDAVKNGQPSDAAHCIPLPFLTHGKCHLQGVLHTTYTMT